MRKKIFIAAGIALAVSGPVAAQDFLGGLARGAARSAAQGLANRAVGAITNPRATAAPSSTAARPSTPPASRSAPATAAPAVTSAATTAPASGQTSGVMPSPAPTNYRPGLRGPYELTFAPAVQAEFLALREFAKEPCHDCEGGFWFNDRVDLMVPNMLDWATPDRIGGMAIGEAIRWNARGGFPMSITVTGDVPIGEYPCKQVRWAATRGDRTIHYDGNVCYGKRGRYLRDPGWMGMGPR